MPKGVSLHIGVNRVDQNHYKGLAELRAAVNDAQFMTELARDRFGYSEVVTLLDEQATTGQVFQTLGRYGESLDAGDILLLSYSGHGGQVEDPNWMQRGEDEAVDETWCLYDRQMIDDELFAAFRKFKPGVRILVVSDSCHSGTVTKAMPPESESGQENEFEQAINDLMQRFNLRSKSVPEDLAGTIYRANAAQYDAIQESLANDPKNKEIDAEVILLAACQDNQIAFDGLTNGRFTSALRQIILQEFAGAGDVHALYNKVKTAFSYPTPNLFIYGAYIPSFESNIPFEINIPEPGRVQPRIASELVAATVAPQMPPPADLRPVPKIPMAVTIESAMTPLTLDTLTAILPPGFKNIRFSGEAGTGRVVVEWPDDASASVWALIHTICERADTRNITLTVEPFQQEAVPMLENTPASKDASETFDYMPQWPPISTGGDAPFGWHLGSDFSQIAEARDRVLAARSEGKIEGKVRVAHFDTGYMPSHPAIWSNPNILRDLARSFVPNEVNNKAIDVFYADGEQQFHGLGTLTILAGGKVNPDQTYGTELPFVGAVPFAEVIPMRIADKVILLESESFSNAVDYAIELGCEVITMSMGGKPSSAMARAVNKAYEAGIVIVTAAGNSMTKGFASIGPRTVVWPARFARVVPACGACQNYVPYDFEAQSKYGNAKGQYDSMQGNWGPAEAMEYALAAFTPNIPWAVYGEDKAFKKSGGGTSSATPQVAAMAAIYIAMHKEEMRAKGYYEPGNQWKKVEAVRRALFAAADKTTFPLSKQYYGNGIIKASRALDVPVMDISDDMKMPKAESSWFGLWEAVGLFANRRRADDKIGPNRRDALSLELMQVLMSDPALSDLFNSLDFQKPWDQPTLDRVADAVRNSSYASETLKSIL